MPENKTDFTAIYYVLIIRYIILFMHFYNVNQKCKLSTLKCKPVNTDTVNPFLLRFSIRHLFVLLDTNCSYVHSKKQRFEDIQYSIYNINDLRSCTITSYTSKSSR